MSLREYLIKKGFNKEVADSICFKIEFDLPLTKDQEDFYWEWFNKYVVEKGGKPVETNHN